MRSECRSLRRTTSPLRPAHLTIWSALHPDGSVAQRSKSALLRCVRRIAIGFLLAGSTLTLDLRSARQPVGRGGAKGGPLGVGFTRVRGSSRTSAMTSAGSARWYAALPTLAFQPGPAPAPAISCCPGCWPTSGAYQPWSRSGGKRESCKVDCRVLPGTAQPRRTRIDEPNRPTSGHWSTGRQAGSAGRVAIPPTRPWSAGRPRSCRLAASSGRGPRPTPGRCRRRRRPPGRYRRG
jgi:hypothetical protein